MSAGTSTRAIGWDRRAAWIGGIAALALIRLSIPLVALAAQHVALPWQPRWEYRPFEGDANGYHAAAREAIAAAARVPAPLAYWPKGYVELFHGETSADEHPWAFAYVDDAWTDSSLFTPRLVLLLAPLALLGCVAVRDRLSLAILATPVVVNAVVYSFYDVTKLHPRFLYGALPSLFVLEAAGGVLVATRVTGLVRRRRAFEFR